MDLPSYFPICIGFRKPNSEEDRNTFLIFYLFILKCAHPQKLSETDQMVHYHVLIGTMSK